MRFFRLRLTGLDTSNNVVQIPLVRVGGQGGLLDSARVEGGVEANGFDWKFDKGEILLDPGERADVVAVFPTNATGVFTLWTEDYQRTGNGNFAGIPTVPVAHFNIVGAVGGGYSIAAGTPLLTSMGKSVEQLTGPFGSLLDPATFSPAKAGLTGPAIPDIRLTNAGNKLGINGIHGDHDFPNTDYSDIPHMGSARYARLGDTVELTVSNPGGAHHPFHLHGFSIQPIRFDNVVATSPADGAGGPMNPGPVYVFPYHEFRDTVDIPGGYALTARVRFDDRPKMDGTTMGGGVGRWVFHCHIFFHASFGMLSELDVVGPSGNERPDINANGTELGGNSGDTLTMHGTYKDPDGDTPIALGASTGTISDDGNGKNWTWTGSAPSSTLVYVTATDPGGLKGQTAFALKLNAPPVLRYPVRRRRTTTMPCRSMSARPTLTTIRLH